MSAALGEERTELHTTVSSYGGIGAGHMATHHGQDGKKHDLRQRAHAARASMTCSTTWVRWYKSWVARCIFCRPSACLLVPA